MRTLIYLIITAILSIAALHCGINDQAGSGSQTTNSRCIGKIYTNDKTAAVGAVVRLIPSGYDPASPSAGGIDSTTTDNNGSYSFTVTKTDFYNIIAEKGATSCIQDSVPLLTDKENIISNDTLEGTGFLAGKIEVKPGSDPKQAIVLVPGTNRYTSPVDTLGTFPPLALPAGDYAVRIVTTESGYGVVDTTVTITSGKTTNLEVRLPTEYAPAITNVTATFDSVLRTATLQWEPVDTALIRSYAIHRILDGVEDTLIIVDKQLSRYIDNHIPPFITAFRYEITAVGTSYKEGYTTASPPIHIAETKLSITRIPLNKFAYAIQYGIQCVDADGNFYTNNQKSIFRIASDGRLLNIVDIAATTHLESASISAISSDRYKNIYLHMVIDSGTRNTSEYPYTISIQSTVLIKLNSEFKVIASLPIPKSYICTNPYENWRFNDDELITIGADGTVFLHSCCDTVPAKVSKIRVYDANLKYQNTFTFNEEVSIKRCYGDTIIAISPAYPNIDIQDDRCELRIIKIFDRSFNLLSSYESMNLYTDFRYLVDGPGRPSTIVYPLTGAYSLTSNNWGVYFDHGYDSISTEIIAIYDNRGKLIDKVLLPGNTRLCIPSPEVIYGMSDFMGSFLYKISLKPLFTK